MSVRLGLRLSQAELDVQNKGSLSGLVAICKCERATLTAEALNKVCVGAGREGGVREWEGRDAGDSSQNGGTIFLTFEVHNPPRLHHCTPCLASLTLVPSTYLQGLHPVWDEFLTFEVHNPTTASLEIKVVNQRTLRKDSVVGQVRMWW